MTDKPKAAPDKAKEDEKQLKKLLDSYTTVATHKLGRPPTLEDLTKMLTENSGQEELGDKPAATPIAKTPPGGKASDALSDTEPKQAPQPLKKDESAPGATPEDQESEPAILHMQCYYGMSGNDEARKPDQGNILYYKHPSGRFYDTTSQEWSDTQPPMAQHLPSRPIQFNERDIVSAIAHGVMEDGDFEALDKAQMIGNTPRRLWELTKKLGGLHDTLQKSAETEVDTDSEPEVDPELSGETTASSGGVDAVGEFMSVAGVERSSEEPQGQGEVGEDLIKQIMEAAVSAVHDAMSSEMESKIRAIVQQELQKLNGDAEQDLQPAGQPDTMQEL